MSIYNEYSKLKTVFIGKVFPKEYLLDIASISTPVRLKQDDQKRLYTRQSKKESILNHLIQVHEETNEDLDNMQKFLESQGVKVYRPNINKYYEEIKHRQSSPPSSPSSIRDWCFSYGNDIVICKLSYPSRWNEWLYWKDAFDDLAKQGKTIHHMVDPNNREIENACANFVYGAVTDLNSTSINTMDTNIRKQLDTLKRKPPTPWNTFRISNYNGYLRIINDYRKNLITSIDAFKQEVESLYIYTSKKLKNIPLLHAASFFKFDDRIIGTPQGTKKGYDFLTNIVKKSHPNVKFIELDSVPGHIDGGANPIDKDCIATSMHDLYKGIVKEIISVDDAYNGGILEVPHNIQNWEILNFIEKTKPKESVLAHYLKTLRGYDQRGDFDYNSLTYAPKKIMGSIFGEGRNEFFQQAGITITQLGLRHRWILDGGVHCYTLDIDRE